ncbi:MAG: fatty acid desaturase [Thiolinea sp.]
MKTNAVKADRSLYKNGYAVQETEWPTLILIGLNYALFIGLTLYFAEFSWWLILPLAAFQQALFGSLQHEVLHGHPTRYQWLNELLVFPALNLWIPYPIYKKSHLIHHNNQHLTDPVRDPESFYIPEQRWQTMPAWQQAYQRFYHTFAGRILWGPLHVVFSLFYYETRALLAGDTAKWRIWGIHVIACLPVVWWVFGVCEIPVWQYLLLFIYPGLSLTLIRSYLEHRAVPDPGHRSVIVEAGPFFSLLFLNNNLHAVHHANPGLAWYRIPAVWRAERERVLQRNDAYYYPGYGAVLRQYFLRKKEDPCFRL